MAVVHFGTSLRQHTGGVAEVDIDAPTVRRLIKMLDAQFPGIGVHLSEGTSVAINGEIIANATYEEIPEGAEIHFLPTLSGG